MNRLDVFDFAVMCFLIVAVLTVGVAIGSPGANETCYRTPIVKSVGNNHAE